MAPKPTTSNLGVEPETQAYIDQRTAELESPSTDLAILGDVWSNSMGPESVIEKRGGRTAKKVPGSSVRAAGKAWRTPRNPTIRIQDGQDFTAAEIFNEVYNISQTDAGEWEKIQRELYMGGFYGNADLADLSFGQPDDMDVKAISTVLSWTARHNAASKAQGGRGDTSWRTILGGYAKELIGPRMEQMAKAAQRQRDAPKISLADPKGLALAIDDVAKNVLGRKANAEEKRLFISTFHAMQSGAQSAESGTVVNPDAEGQAEAILRERNRAEAGAHDVANTFNDFLQILSGGFD
jgi:hypothetical protein